MSILNCRNYKIYLGGPIAGLSYEQATKWRKEFKDMLPIYLDVRSPMRDKEKYKNIECFGKQGEQYNDPLSTPKAILTRDYNDCVTADVLVVNLLETTEVSIGSVMEIAWAHSFRVPTVLIIEKGNVHCHSLIHEAVGFEVNNLEQAAEAVRSVLNV